MTRMTVVARADSVPRQGKERATLASLKVAKRVARFETIGIDRLSEQLVDRLAAFDEPDRTVLAVGQHRVAVDAKNVVDALEEVARNERA